MLSKEKSRELRNLLETYQQDVYFALCHKYHRDAAQATELAYKDVVYVYFLNGASEDQCAEYLHNKYPVQ